MRRDAWATRGWSVSARIGLYTGPRTPTGCREWLAAQDLDGYALMKVSGRMLRVTRVLLGLPLGDARVAMHSCDNPCCVEPSHLSIGTQADNAADKVAKGRGMHGERNTKAKLTAEQIAEIRRRGSRGEGCVVMSKEFDVNPSTISAAVLRKTWRHLP